MKKTRFGQALRATIQHPEAARLLGIDTDRIAGYGFGLGLATAAIGGTALVPGLDDLPVPALALDRPADGDHRGRRARQRPGRGDRRDPARPVAEPAADADGHHLGADRLLPSPCSPRWRSGLRDSSEVVLPSASSPGPADAPASTGSCSAEGRAAARRRGTGAGLPQHGARRLHPVRGRRDRRATPRWPWGGTSSAASPATSRSATRALLRARRLRDRAADHRRRACNPWVALGVGAVRSSPCSRCRSASPRCGSAGRRS